MSKKTKFKVKPNIELMAIEAKKVLPKISQRIGFRIQRKARINAFTDYFTKSPESEEQNYQKNSL